MRFPASLLSYVFFYSIKPWLHGRIVNQKVHKNVFENAIKGIKLVQFCYLYYSSEKLVEI
jgi:hypothetical protein